MVKGVSVRMAIVVSSAVEKASADMIEGVRSSVVVVRVARTVLEGQGNRCNMPNMSSGEVSLVIGKGDSCSALCGKIPHSSHREHTTRG